MQREVARDGLHVVSLLGGEGRLGQVRQMARERYHTHCRHTPAAPEHCSFRKGVWLLSFGGGIPRSLWPTSVDGRPCCHWTAASGSGTSTHTCGSFPLNWGHMKIPLWPTRAGRREGESCRQWLLWMRCRCTSSSADGSVQKWSAVFTLVYSSAQGPTVTHEQHVNAGCTKTIDFRKCGESFQMTINTQQGCKNGPIHRVHQHGFLFIKGAAGGHILQK